jgi:hypothetical protein
MKGYKLRPKGHYIHYTLPNGSKKKLYSKVYLGKHQFSLSVKSEDVDRAEALGGAGTTMACMMAICPERQKNVVPHRFEFVEWTDNMAYFITEMQLGKPAKCIAYRHSDKIAAQFDSKTGRRALRKRLAEEGEIIVKLSPPAVRASRVGMNAPKGAKTGSRTHNSATKTKGAYRRLERTIPILQQAQLLARVGA